MNLSKREQETIFLFTEADRDMIISTYNAALKDTLAGFCQYFPEVCRLQYQTEEGRDTYCIARNWASVCFAPLMLFDLLQAI